MNYRSAGVDIKKGENLVQWLKEQASVSPHVVSGIGGFSGLFRVMFSDMQEPCLSASTDGVGTKVKLALHFKRYAEIGQDLVAMCVNDVICSGAKPLFFMDYYACGKLKAMPWKQFLTGVKKACQKSHLVLLGGETAEMPDCYTEGNFDCAGFAVGVVDRSQVLGAHRVQIGDHMIGVSSSGFHSNGFSLLRKVFAKDLKSWEKDLVEPTALYADLALSIFDELEGAGGVVGIKSAKLKESSAKKGLKAIAHITGGGFDNILRVLPQGMGAKIKLWEIPFSFREVQKRASLNERELMTTFNCGVGLVLVVTSSLVDLMWDLIEAKGFKALNIGEVVALQNKKPEWFFG